MKSVFPLLVAVCLGVASPAAAQIYTWHDAQGTLVLSDRPREAGQVPTYAVYGGSKAIRATTPLKISPKSIQYDRSIQDHATRNGLSPDLVRAVIQVESAFNPNALSPKGAMGLMQLMPATAAEYGVRDAFHPEQNIGAGVAYLKRLLNRYDNKIELALAAYNAGMGNVEKYGKVPPFKETQSYVKRITESSPLPPPVKNIYKWMDLVGGKPVTRYSNAPPPSGAYEVVGAKH
jgi:soluble lytic murein transglycosylase-like protein